jgi:hypothetical protein
MISLTVHPASSSLAPDINIHFKMNDLVKQNVVRWGRRWAGMVRLPLAGLLLGFIVLAARAQTVSPFNLPLYFEANPDRTEFLSRGDGYQFLISADGVQIALRNGAGHPGVARMSFVGGNARAAICGEGELTGKINYLIGSDASKWQTGLPTFSKVQVSEVYPGINLVFHGNQQQLEYDFAIAPAANPNAIKMRFDGVDKISIAPDGELILKVGAGEIRQPKPEIYLAVAGGRKIIDGGYKILDARTVAFDIGSYDRSLPLVIDPLLSFSTFFAGSSLGTTAWAIARDTNDFTYIAGQTFSKQFFTEGAFQTNFAGGTLAGDAFVAKFGDPATNLVYLTYLGGSSDDAAYAIAVDSSSHAFVAGATQSTNFPVTNAVSGHANISGVFDKNVGRYPTDAFVTELSADGSSLVYSTYLGGNSSDAAYGIALDSADNAYITGFTYSTNFPVFPDPASVLQNHLACTNSIYLNANAFVTEIPSGGSAPPLYSTYLGGTNFDTGRAIAVDANNYVYIAGFTASTNFPVINQPTNVLPNFPAITHLNGSTNVPARTSFDAFVTKFPPLSTHPSSISSLVYSTFLGGTNSDQANGIAADSDGNAYVTGWTTSTNFPVVFSSLINTNPAGLYSFLTTNGNAFSGVTNVFLTKIASDGSQILDSIVFGGNGMDIGNGVAVDLAGDAFVVGTSSSTNFPTVNTFASLSHTNNAGLDVFVTGISADWTSTYYSVLIGGKKDEQGYGIVLDSATNAFITGYTASTNFPTANTGRFSFTFTNIVIDTNVTFITNVVDSTNVIITSTNFTTNFVAIVTNTINGTNFINGSNFTGTNDAFLSEILFTTPSPTNIDLEPTNEIVGVGGTTRFALTVTGISTPVLYQWQHETFTNLITTNIIVGVSTNKVTNSVSVFTNLLNSGRFSGATSNILTITNVMTTDSSGSSNYQAIITWGDAPYITNATLEVEQGPVIVVPPDDQTNFFGGTATFTVTAFGTQPLHYQWLFNGTNLVNSSGHISGATTNTLTITGLNTNNEGSFEVVITNAFGSTNASANLTMITTSPTNIDLEPTNEIVGVGGTARFTLIVTGTSTPVFYQWQREIFTNVIITNIIIGVSTNKVTNSVPTGIYTNLLNSGRISGVTNNVLTITNVTTADGNDGSPSNYQAVITWGDAPFITNATLEVEQGPVIAVPPEDQTNVFRGTATFTVTAFGQSPLHYQWLFDGTNLVNSSGHVSGATTNILTITGLNTNNEGSFEVVITNSFGSTNASANLTMITTSPTNITLVPTNEIVGVGGTATFTLTVAGTSTPVFYQWQREIFTNVIITNIIIGVSTNKVTNSVPTGIYTNLLNSGRISGVTNNVLTITNVTTADGNDGSPSNYQAVITWGDAPFITNATFEVEQGPVIAVPPEDQTNVVGGTATFTVTAFGQSPLHYQWLFDGTNLVNSSGHVSGATTNILTITGLNTNNEGSFEVVITNSFGSTNASATLTLITAPLIVTPLTNQTVGLGAPVTFAVTVEGGTPLRFGWTMNGITLTNGTDVIGTTTNIISGATNDTLTLTGATTNDNGTYEVTVTNSFGATNSSAELTVLTAPRLSIRLDSGFATNGFLDFDVVGGTNSGQYDLLFTNNLLASPTNWPRVGPATFSTQGHYSFFLNIDTNYAQQFYMLQLVP